jgi:ATP-dependent DNA helicase DinG
VRILDEGGSDDDSIFGEDVVWLGGDRSRRAVRVAPLSVADLLRTRLFGDSTVVLTSATLALGGRFTAMLASWGLSTSKCTTLDVGTPFDAGTHGILYMARHLDPPGRDAASPTTMDELAQLINAAGGRTLGLFSSRRAAEAAAAEMRTLVPYDIMLQGEDTLGTLIDRFRAEPETCLFGTLSLWQGVDVPGPSLSLVVMDRIPFPRPDDPLMQARKEAADKAGRNGFMEVSATHAALLMAQGAGRLLRSVDDRGVVAVLDSRIATKRYGSFFRSSMPPFWTTTDGGKVRGALRRLRG